MTSRQHTPRCSRPRLRRVLRAIGRVLVTAAMLVGVAAAGAVVTDRSLHQPVLRSSAQPSTAAHPGPESSAPSRNGVRQGHRPIVAVVVGGTGTIASDLLAPYDIFASSPSLTTYVVADDEAPAPLEGGPAVVPTYTFATVDADPALRPDLVVVPGLSEPTSDAEAPLRSWVARQHDKGAKVLGVCSGALVLASTGMLDGLFATSHWSRLEGLQRSRPAVHWLRGRRYVEDGSVTTTAAVTSGVPAALHLVAELSGRTEAQRIADLHPELGWTATEATRIADQQFAASDWPVGLNFVMPWFRPTIGIALYDGIGELDATAAFEVYSQSAAARTLPLATTDTIRTRHGLVLLTTSLNHAPALSRVVVPGAATLTAVDPRMRAWADRQQVPVEPLASSSGTGGTRDGSGGFLQPCRTWPATPTQPRPQRPPR